MFSPNFYLIFPKNMILKNIYLRSRWVTRVCMILPPLTGTKRVVLTLRAHVKKSWSADTPAVASGGGSYFYGRIIFTPQIIFTKQIPIFLIFKNLKIWKSLEIFAEKSTFNFDPVIPIVGSKSSKVSACGEFSSKFRNDILQPGFRNKNFGELGNVLRRKHILECTRKRVFSVKRSPNPLKFSPAAQKKTRYVKLIWPKYRLVRHDRPPTNRSGSDD